MTLLLKEFTIKTFAKLLKNSPNLQKETSPLSFLKKQSVTNFKKYKQNRMLKKKSSSVSIVDKEK